MKFPRVIVFQTKRFYCFMRNGQKPENLFVNVCDELDFLSWGVKVAFCFCFSLPLIWRLILIFVVEDGWNWMANWPIPCKECVSDVVRDLILLLPSFSLGDSGWPPPHQCSWLVPGTSCTCIVLKMSIIWDVAAEPKYWIWVGLNAIHFRIDWQGGVSRNQQLVWWWE